MDKLPTFFCQTSQKHILILVQVLEVIKNLLFPEIVFSMGLFFRIDLKEHGRNLKTLILQ
jgi:hypothetical protein